MAFEGDLANWQRSQLGGEVKAVKSVEKEEGADAVVKVVGLSAKLVEGVRFGEKLLKG